MASADGMLRALRTEAESIIEGHEGRPTGAASTTLERELLLHAIELRLQNEALREAELERAAAQARYRELFALAPVAYVTLAADSQVLEANEATAMLLELSPHELVGQRLSRFIAHDSVRGFALHRQSVLANGLLQVCEVELVSARGVRRQVRLQSTYSPHAADVWRMAILDVTELNELQRERRKAHALEAMGTLAAGVAHDVNNMLAAISGFAELARRRSSEPGGAREALEDLSKAVDRGRALIGSVLSVVRDSAEASRTDLHATVLQSEPMLRQLIAPGVQLELALDAKRGLVRGHAAQLENVVLNLVRNASDAMPNGGPLRISTRDLAPSEAPAALAGPRAPACCVLSVEDTGEGMEPVVAARALRPFFTTKASRQGTGLGLWMVELTVRSAGGHVEIDSSPGGGTRVHVYLPYA